MSTWTARLAVGAGALALTLVVTWPLPRCFDTCLGASEDPLLSVYYLGWVTHSLVTPGVRLLDASIFAPYTGTLALGEYLPAYAVLALPAIALTGSPVVAHNVVVVAAYTLAALGGAALAARLTGAAGPALLAGLAFAYSPRLLHQAHNVQTLSAFWFPWLFLALERFLERPTWAAAAVLAGVWLGLALSSMIAFAYAAVAAGVFLVVAVAWGGRRLARPHLLRLAAAGVPAVALLAAYLAPYRALAREWRLGRALAEVERYSAAPGDVLGVPPEHLVHRLVGIGHVVDLDREALFPGLAVLALATAGLAAVARGPGGLRPAFLPYVVMGGAAAVLALGPTLATPWGPWPLPYRLLYAVVPGFDAIRTPRRFAGFLAFGLALLVAAGAARALGRLNPARRRVVLAAVAALILVESIGVPFPGAVRRLDPAELPEVYRWLGTQDARTVALELPIGDDWESVAAAAFHLRRTVNGWASYTPPHYDALVAAMDAFPDARTLALIRGLRPDVVLVDRRWLDPAREAALGALRDGLRLERAVDTHLVYRVEGAAPPGIETLEATARLAPAREGRPAEACVTLWNPGSDFVPLYPLRRLRLEAGSRPDGPTPAESWLPLDLAPGAAHTACARLAGRPEAVRVRGEVEGAGRVHRFAVTPGTPPQRLVPAR